MNTFLLPTRNGARFAGLLCTFAVLASLSPKLVAEEELGRLFFTPERRQILDRQRLLNIQEKQEIPEEPTFTINGLVTRSSGKRTAWINGVAQNENETQSGVSITPKRREPGKVVVQASESPTANASVGDTVNRNTGESIDLLKGGSISLTPPRKASGR